MIDRDQADFLNMGRKHNIRKEIKKTKTQIKKLEKELISKIELQKPLEINYSPSHSTTSTLEEYQIN